MRPASDVISRLQWDTGLVDATDVSIGYLDRFEGIKEIDFCAWLTIKGDVTEEEFIPQHRIRYFKVRTTKEIIWDKTARIDKVFGSAGDRGKSGSPEVGDQSG